jgi:hypothetical protein
MHNILLISHKLRPTPSLNRRSNHNMVIHFNKISEYHRPTQIIYRIRMMKNFTVLGKKRELSIREIEWWKQMKYHEILPQDKYTKHYNFGRIKYQK